MGGLIALALAALGALVFVLKRARGEESPDGFEGGAAWFFALFLGLFGQMYIFEALGLFEAIRTSGASPVETYLFLCGCVMIVISYRFAGWVSPPKEKND